LYGCYDLPAIYRAMADVIAAAAENLQFQAQKAS